MPRLSAGNLRNLSPAVEMPRHLHSDAGIGHVHLGVGAFMRAHIAVYNDEAMRQAGGDWSIAGVSLRNTRVRDQLEPQDCLYNVAVCDNEATRYRLISSIKSINVAPENPGRVVSLIADPTVNVVTLTVTEQGYGIAPESGSLDANRLDIAHDLESLERPQSVLGFLVAGLVRRRDERAGPITVISCDNLRENGTRLRKALFDFVDQAGIGVRDWMDEFVRFPQTMADRIVPATTEDDLKGAEAAIGLTDAAFVRTEPFTQWIIEDDFAGPRPAWDEAGAMIVDRVAPYETAKLRLLNGAHSALAYLGFLGGYSFVHEAMADPRYSDYVDHLMRSEIAPVSPEPAGMRHASYIDSLQMRFRNTSLRHRTAQIAADGSHKLPQRLLNPIREQLRRNGPITDLSLAVAGWMRYTMGFCEDGQLIDVKDPLAARFADIVAQTTGDAKATVNGFLEVDSVFGNDLAQQPRFVSTVTRQLSDLMRLGVTCTVDNLVGGYGQA